MALLDESEVEDFWSTLAAAGYAKDNFELTEIQDRPQTTGTYALNGKAVARRKSTSITREYRAGNTTAWVADFDAELHDGVYGTA